VRDELLDVEETKDELAILKQRPVKVRMVRLKMDWVEDPRMDHCQRQVVMNGAESGLKWSQKGVLGPGGPQLTGRADHLHLRHRTRRREALRQPH
jgi:hypothetical protein